MLNVICERPPNFSIPSFNIITQKPIHSQDRRIYYFQVSSSVYFGQPLAIDVNERCSRKRNRKNFICFCYTFFSLFDLFRALQINAYFINRGN